MNLEGPLRLLLELALAATAGTLAVLVRGWLSEVRRLSQSIGEIASSVQKHGESLAMGYVRFETQAAELSRLGGILDELQREGCAYRKACSSTNRE